MANHLVVYERRPCWWCGARLSIDGVRKVIDLVGNELKVHGGMCYKQAVETTKPLTAHPRLWPNVDGD